jgi:hypothetical protein
MHADITAACPVSPKILVTFTRAAESVGENDDWKRSSAGFGQVKLCGHLAISRFVLPFELEDFDLQ